MAATGIIATIRAALVAVPIIAEEFKKLRNAIEAGKNERAELEKQQILDRLNTLSSRLRTTDDENEFASIIRDINRLF